MSKENLRNRPYDILPVAGTRLGIDNTDRALVEVHA